MEITFLGHAGFCVDTANCTVITDPWLSPNGAFDSAWFQFPRNHHMAAFVQEKLADDRKQRFIYISHEHKDHFDIEFLNTLRCRDFTFVVPKFCRDALRRQLQDYGARLVAIEHDEEFGIPGGSLKLFLDDSGLNRDSALLVRADQTFLNFNDCKLYDQVPKIAAQEGSIDVFACQFSGATWHPTCYEYSKEAYERISRKKVISKFESVAQCILNLKPRFYIPSAGPACFLDPMLFHLNCEPVNIFPRAPRIIEYLSRRIKNSTVEVKHMMPGDAMEVSSGADLHKASKRVDESNVCEYLKEYAALYENLFAERQRSTANIAPECLCDRLAAELSRKLASFKLHRQVSVPLYFRISDMNAGLRVDFINKRVERSDEIPEEPYYMVSAPSWEVVRVLHGKLTWEDFSLTFRMRLSREPDIYQTLLQGFLILEAEDLDWFCAQLLNTNSKNERIVVEAGGKRFAIDRYCPHQGGDLKSGWVSEERYLTCPRHGWKFDLANAGKCLSNDTCLNAIPLDDD